MTGDAKGVPFEAVEVDEAGRETVLTGRRLREALEELHRQAVAGDGGRPV